VKLVIQDESPVFVSPLFGLFLYLLTHPERKVNYFPPVSVGECVRKLHLANNVSNGGVTHSTPLHHRCINCINRCVLYVIPHPCSSIACAGGRRSVLSMCVNTRVNMAEMNLHHHDVVGFSRDRMTARQRARSTGQVYYGMATPYTPLDGREHRYRAM